VGGGFKLTVHPTSVPIAAEHTLGYLEEAKDPRFFTHSVLYVPFQIIAVHRSSYISRYAKSAKTFATIYKALKQLEMEPHYSVEVDPIAQVGSFIEWMNSIDYLQKILIKYTGPNLPGPARRLIESIRGAGKEFKKALHAKDVELSANEPELNNEEVTELDEAAAERIIKLKARGFKTGIVTNWSSKTKPVPEIYNMPFNEDQLNNTELIANSIKNYIDDRFDRGQIEK
jgi:hypothetical protein